MFLNRQLKPLCSRDNHVVIPWLSGSDKFTKIAHMPLFFEPFNAFSKSADALALKRAVYCIGDCIAENVVMLGVIVSEQQSSFICHFLVPYHIVLLTNI